MPVTVLNPNNLDPDETHEHSLDTEIRVGERWGTVFDRGYTVPDSRPVYAYICDDNVQRTVVENNIDEVREGRMTEYTITIDGYTSGLTEEGVEKMIRTGLPHSDDMDVTVEEQE
jgi:hypothetical protein